MSKENTEWDEVFLNGIDTTSSHTDIVSNETRELVDWILWMKKIQIETNWETKEIYLDDQNLRIDSLNWKIIEIDWRNVKINPEWDIIEYTDWPAVGEQLFTIAAAIRESKKLWKIVLNRDETKAVIEAVWIKDFTKVHPGFITYIPKFFRYSLSLVPNNVLINSFEDVWDNDRAYFLTSTIIDEKVRCICYSISRGKIYNGWAFSEKSFFSSVRLAKY